MILSNNNAGKGNVLMKLKWIKAYGESNSFKYIINICGQVGTSKDIKYYLNADIEKKQFDDDIYNKYEAAYSLETVCSNAVLNESHSMKARFPTLKKAQEWVQHTFNKDIFNQVLKIC